MKAMMTFGALPGLGGQNSNFNSWGNQDMSRSGQMPDFGRADPSIPGFGGWNGRQQPGPPPQDFNAYGREEGTMDRRRRRVPQRRGGH